MDTAKLLRLELETYESKRAELIKESLGKFILIRGKEIIGTYDSQQDALKAGVEKFGNTPFLVKKIELIEHSQNFTSNLIRCELQCPQ
ncbi:MAG: hypothetical protein AABY26_06725 [Nanoarchaeota archaeon]|mgnify:CR=1 FL=1